MGVAMNAASVGRARAQDMSDLKVTELDRNIVTLRSSTNNIEVDFATGDRRQPLFVRVINWSKGTSGLNCERSFDEPFVRLIDLGPMGGGPTIGTTTVLKPMNNLANALIRLKDEPARANDINVLNDVKKLTRAAYDSCFGERPVASNSVRVSVG